MKQTHIVNIAIKDRDGNVIGHKPVIKYEGLLSEAHAQGLRSIHTELVQVPSKANGDVAIVRAVVVTCKGTFAGIGDASPSNVNNRVGNALIRVAETRSKARALRDACNFGMLALDELDDADEIDAVDPARRAIGAQPVSAPANANVPETVAIVSRDDLMTPAQRRLLFRIAAERGVATDDIAKWLENHCGLKGLRGWSKTDASRVIERLKANGHAGSAP